MPPEDLVGGDGAVLVPARLVSTVFAATTLYLADQTRTNGGALTPEARSFLRALHGAAQGAVPVPDEPTSPRGSEVGDGDMVGAHEVASVLQCSRRWATHLLSSGRLDAWRVGRDWVTTRRDLDRYRFEEHPRGKPGPAAQPEPE
ncbi:hypothetical protein GCM10018773_15800 [Streptomyces candidus]|nr:hypothetical protein GCM10018773_15800 [Streptomyces candidus]